MVRKMLLTFHLDACASLSSKLAQSTPIMALPARRIEKQASIGSHVLSSHDDIFDEMISLLRSLHRTKRSAPTVNELAFGYNSRRRRHPQRKPPKAHEPSQTVEFMSLPVELREIVYELCFKDAHIHLKYNHRCGCNTNAEEWSLLFTNKKVYLEAQPTYFKHATLYLRIGEVSNMLSWSESVLSMVKRAHVYHDGYFLNKKYPTPLEILPALSIYSWTTDQPFIWRLHRFKALAKVYPGFHRLDAAVNTAINYQVFRELMFLKISARDIGGSSVSHYLSDSPANLVVTQITTQEETNWCDQILAKEGRKRINPKDLPCSWVETELNKIAERSLMEAKRPGIGCVSTHTQ